MGNFIDFFDGYTTDAVPIIVQADRLLNFPDDATAEAGIVGAPLEGNLYFNTTLNLIRYYNGTDWNSVVDEDSIQTIVNKVINADNNTITNIELDNFKAGVVDTDLTDGTSGVHDTIPSAKATKDYVDAHINNTTAAHHASAIEVTPAGGIGSINVANALNELDGEKYDKTGGTVSGSVTITGDLTVNGTTTSVNSTTLDVADSNITVNNGGDQATADLNDAGLTVEMSDATDAVIGYDSTTTSKFRIGESGSTEEILTTNHTQDVTNKTFTDYVTVEEQASTPSTPPTGDQRIYPKTDGEWYKLDDAGVETKLGSGGGLVKTTYHDPISAALPTGTSVTIDGQAGVNGDRVLFTNLASGNNKIYELGGVGVSLTWTVTNDFNAGTPEDGDTVIVLAGDSFREAIGKFDGTDWVFNDTVRYYSGEDYWEQSSLKTTNITASTTASIFEVNLAGSENVIIDYSILRGANKETGTFTITSDGTNIDYSQTSANIGNTGTTLFADINVSTLRFRYTSDSGGTGSIKYTVKRWSNTAGGPGGIPSYSGGASGGSAAGNNTDIQFNLGGSLSADSNFQWDGGSLTLTLGNLDYKGMTGTTTLVDNQTTPTTIFSFPGSSYKFMFVEYSIERGGESRVGTLMICHNDTVAVLTDTSADTGGSGIDNISIPLTATYSAGNVLVQYTTDNTGNSGDFKYSTRKWL